MTYENIALVTAALAFGAMGAGALASPRSVLGQFGIRNLSAAAKNEVRAVYGGFGLAAALLLFAIAIGPAPISDTLRSGVTLAFAVALFGMAFGRILSALIDRRMDRTPIAYLTIEIVVGALLIFGGKF